MSRSATYCLMSAFLGSVRMRTKSPSVSAVSSTRIGSRPCSSGNQVGRLADVKGSRGDEQNVIGADHAVARVDRRAFDDGQNVALHAFAGDVRAVAGLAPGDLVDFIDENDAHLLGALDGQARHLIHVDQFVFFFLDQIIECLGDGHPAALFLLAKHSRRACP